MRRYVSNRILSAPARIGRRRKNAARDEIPRFPIRTDYDWLIHNGWGDLPRHRIPREVLEAAAAAVKEI